MKNTLIIVSSILLIAITSSCKCHKKNKTPNASQTVVPAKKELLKGSGLYHVSISFYSIAFGPDFTAIKATDALINSWQEKTGKIIEKEVVNWGREGETDYCLNLDELDQKDQDSFIAELKSTLSTKERVNIKEKSECRKIQR